MKSTASLRASSPVSSTRGRYLLHPRGLNHHAQARTTMIKSTRPLLGNFEENILNNRLEPIRTVDGYTAEVRASCNQYQPNPLKSGVQMSFFSMGDSFPYLGRIHLGSRGYRIPKRGTVQVTLFNPHGTLVKLFLLFYDLADMPPNSQTFLRQKTLILPKASGDNNIQSDKEQLSPSLAANTKRRVKYLIQLNIVSSKTGRVYLNKDVRIFISKKTDMETASQLTKQDYEVKAFEEMPNNPRYFSR